MNKYNEVLSLFAGKENLRTWMHKPFLHDNKAISTDATTMAIVPIELTEGVEPNETAPKAFKVIPVIKPLSLELKLQDLKAALEKCPTTEDYDVVGKDVECQECGGEGYVEWEYKSYTKEHECPCCNGDGLSERAREIPNGKMKYESHKYIRVKDSFFNVYYLARLVRVCEILEQDVIRLISAESDRSCSVFKIGEVEILLMPVTDHECFAELLTTNA